MVSLAPATSGATADDERDDSLEVVPVDPPSGSDWRDARTERLRRRVLEARVAVLEAELDRARRRRAEVVSRYEQVLSSREGCESPCFSWVRRG